MTMYCPGHGERLPCAECRANLDRRLERDAAAEQTKEWGAPGAIPPVAETCPADIWENTIRAMGVHAACEWFGYRPNDEFTVETIRVLRERSSGRPE